MALKFGVIVNVDVRALQRNMLLAIAAEFNVLASDGVKFMNKKIADWKNKTKFRKEVKVVPGKWLFSILHNSQSPEGKIFNYVNWGTEGPYEIKPKNAKMLAFSVPNSPKTRAPGQTLVKGPKMRVFSKKGVTHPGIEARRMDLKLRAIYEKTIVPKTRAAARKGLAKR